jgi:hypothetical protein
LGVNEKDSTPTLAMMDRDECTRLELSSDDNEKSRIVFFDKNGTSRQIIGDGDGNSRGMLCLDEHGKARLSYWQREEGDVGFTLYDPQENVRGTFSTTDGHPAILIVNDKKEPLFRAPDPGESP